MKLSASLALLALTLAAVAQEEASVNDTARFLAGLPVRDTPLEKYSRERAWSTHAAEFDASWKTLESRQLSKIRAWAPENIGETYAESGPMFYMFSGPDILYAQAFFPNASTYVLCALEPIGAVPDIAKLARGALPSALGNLRKSLNSVLSFSFFITKDMKNDLGHKELTGTVPLLLVFLARGGCTVESVEPVGLDKEGNFTDGKASRSGVKIVFTGAGKKEQTLYYFVADLSNGGIKASPAMLNFCDKLGPGVCLLKAASYLMHSDDFSLTRDFLLSHGKAIVQDDSGIPIEHFTPTAWEVRPFGNFAGPIDLFKKNKQPKLAELYRGARAPKLEFSFGYRWRPSESSLILGRMKDFIPVAPAAPVAPVAPAAPDAPTAP